MGLPWMLRPDNPEDAKLEPGFHLNWGYSENCDASPKPEEGVCTFMGMPTSRLSGKGLEWPLADAHGKKAALDIMRKHGYRCETPPKGWEPDYGEKLEEGNEEIQFLRSHYDPIEVKGKKTDSAEFEVEFYCGWLYIRCNSLEARVFVEKYIRSTPHYELGLLDHEEKRFELDVSNGITLIRRTGGGRVGTLFELQKGSKTLAKSLCSYRNGEMENSGPTIELFEVVGEMRRKGYAKLLLEEMTSYFESVFLGEDCNFPEPINFNICYCTNRHACEWFMRQGFEDLDGMGEELGKHLGEW